MLSCTYVQINYCGYRRVACAFAFRHLCRYRYGKVGKWGTYDIIVELQQKPSHYRALRYNIEAGL